MYISEPAEYAILGLLHSQPMHGYEMFQQFRNATLGEIVHLEMSQMYAFLKKLERLEYIKAQLEPQGSRPPRKVFHLTAVGRNIFSQWLSEPVVRPREVRILFLIKLYFVQQFAPKEAAPLVDKQIAACRGFLARLESKHTLYDRKQSPQTLPANPFVPVPQSRAPEKSADAGSVVLSSSPARLSPLPDGQEAAVLARDEMSEIGYDEAFFEHVVLRGRIYQTRSLLDWLQELQHELAETH